MKKSKKYDFAGWVTKNDLLCSDGVVIKQGAFQKSPAKVPLVWQHDYSSPENVLGYLELSNRSSGVYGYGYFNNSELAQKAKELVSHGDIVAMSMGAKGIKKSGNQVIHGNIYEVSLVLSGANPGATIEEVLTHSSEEEDHIILHNGLLIHSVETEDEDEDEEVYKNQNENNSETEEEDMGKLDSILDKLSDEELDVLGKYIGLEEGDENEGMKHNAFEQDDKDVIKHSAEEVLASAMEEGTLKHGLQTHGITNVEILFPEAQAVSEPITYGKINSATERIISGIKKSPFSKIKSLYFDITAKEARARGYIKGNEKKDEIIKLLKRETSPQTIYKKQKMDRDDLLEIKGFDVVQYLNKEMRMMLMEEIARAVVIGDGREPDDVDRINPEKIRPIISDDDLYTIKTKYENYDDFVDSAIKAMEEYRGSGLPALLIHPSLFSELKLLKDSQGRYLYENINLMASKIGVSEIVPTTFLPKGGAVIVNLNDYTLGSSKGGEITSFEDFDINFNKHIYLIETRLCGALTIPKSAIYIYKQDMGEITTHKEDK